MNEAGLLEAAFRNPINREIVKRLPSLGANDAWLVSGALFQSVWNTLCGMEPKHGIVDYDIFYFDPDRSWEAEDAVIRRASEVFADLGEKVQVRNQARVHLWYPEKFGALYPPLGNACEAIDRFLMTCAQVGVSNRDGRPVVYAPSGFDDIEQMIVRPNRAANFGPERYLAKVQRWKELWPRLTIVAP